MWGSSMANVQCSKILIASCYINIHSQLPAISIASYFCIQGYSYFITKVFLHGLKVCINIDSQQWCFGRGLIFIIITSTFKKIKNFQLEQGWKQIHKKALKQAEQCTILKQLNHSKTIKIVIFLLCLILKQMHSRDITILIILLWFSIVHYSACFSAFLCIYFHRLQLKIPIFLMY